MESICGIVHLGGGPVDRALVERMLAAVPRGRTTLTADARGSALFAHRSPGAGAGPEEARVEPPSGFLAVAAARFDGGSGERWADPDRRNGPGSPLALRGAFATATWVEGSRELRLARDPLGERHLCWARLGDLALFASEPVQLLAAGVSGEPDPERIVAYLLAAPPAATATFFARIERVPPGHLVTVSPAGAGRTAFWSWDSFAGEKGPAAAAPAELIRRLDDAVGRRLPPEGEVGLLLSGGLDSMSLALSADRLLSASGRHLRAFTWTSRSGDPLDETARSGQLLAARSGIREHPVETDGLLRMSRYPEAYDDPNGPEANAFPDLLFATLEAARSAGVAVLLNGLGGDSALGWLAPPLSSLLRGRLRPPPRSPKESIARGIARQVVLSRRRRPLPDWLAEEGRRLASARDLDRPPLSWREAATRDGFRRFALSHFENASTLERLERWSRRRGVRIEAPWYDLRIAALALGLGDRSLPDRPPAKALLRRALQGELPGELLVPEDKVRPASRTEELARNGLAVARDLLRGSRLEEFGLIETKSLLRSLNNESPSPSVSPLVWRVLTTEAWLRNKVNL